MTEPVAVNMSIRQRVSHSIESFKLELHIACIVLRRSAQLLFSMALYLSNLFGCFSECSTESKRYICDGNVCVLKNPKENLANRQKLADSNTRKQNLPSSFGRRFKRSS
ncbi:hypothetical protein LR48_Vigan07g023400 [Vigna angularis]|uniref:Uncharacterized protein n=2 Tax=Phaseolus angularis TaxID=3914 RepID=A0A0L9UUJ6_PHAAN|nr:uncharacterized protein HKW66_Vig0134020 [Vigna angularis]KOM46530.1 hypothetical protein LR48_Vigan07g023400 [Vigna angularis]BAT80704.1 hypothetical protein VIGAN_03030200 [Vigna angularis var. angularis]